MPFIAYYAIGMLFMGLVVFLVGRKFYDFPIWKCICIAVLLTLAGYVGAKLMGLIETGTFDSRSYFGAVLFAPVLMFPVAKLLHVNVNDLFDVCAPCGCIMQSFLKINCYQAGCCKGRVLRTVLDSSGGLYEIRFPSQLVECGASLILFFILLVIIKRGKSRGAVCPWFMVLYGVIRSILNLERETHPFVWRLPAGNFWALITITIGTIWLCMIRKKSVKEMRIKKQKQHKKM